MSLGIDKSLQLLHVSHRAVGGMKGFALEDDHESAMDQISAKLQQKLDAGTYKAWIAPLKGQLEERELTLFASNRFVADWISSRLASTITMVAEETVGYPVVLKVRTATGQKRSSRPVKAENARWIPLQRHAASCSGNVPEH